MPVIGESQHSQPITGGAGRLPGKKCVVAVKIALTLQPGSENGSRLTGALHCDDDNADTC